MGTIGLPPHNDYYQFYGFQRSTTYRDERGIDRISVSTFGSDSRWFINLRPGTRSHNGLEGRDLLSFRIAANTVIENASGSAGADRIIGNGAKNRLHGGDGNDILDGRFGNDMISGGRGNDIFLYRPGQGHDTIGETATYPREIESGYDRLKIAALPGFERLENGYLFTRIGNDLKIDLTLRRSNINGGSILIKDQDAPKGRVETLLLSQGTRNLERISLTSLWSQLQDGQTARFMVVPDVNVRFGSQVRIFDEIQNPVITGSVV